MRNFLTFPYMITKRKHAKFGEIVVLFVQMELSGTQQQTASQSPQALLRVLHKICHRTLPPYWEPRLYIAVDKIPMTENGKRNPRSKELVNRSWVQLITYNLSSTFCTSYSSLYFCILLLSDSIPNGYLCPYQLKLV